MHSLKIRLDALKTVTQLNNNKLHVHTRLPTLSATAVVTHTPPNETNANSTEQKSADRPGTAFENNSAA